MSLLVTGSIGIDTVETPHGRADNVLGGSSIYFALAAALYAPVRLVGVVGDDFDPALLTPLKAKGIDTSGVEFRQGSKTFRWHGRYHANMNERDTVDVALNVLIERPAAIPAAFRDSPYVFLANAHPGPQAEFARQMSRARLIVCDTMDLWITNERPALLEALKLVHGLVLNDAEARQLTGEHNLVKAAKAVLRMGPRFVVVKKGEHGSMIVAEDDLVLVPPYPTEKTIDPTGCGDTYAGALMGWLTKVDRADRAALRAAVARATVVGSFVIESFSIEALSRVGPADVEARLGELRGMVAAD